MPNSKNVCFGIVFLHVILTKQKQLWHQEKHKQLDWLPKHNGSVFVFFLILPCFVVKPLTDGLVCSKCDHLRPHLLVVYQIVCSHGRAFVFKDLPWVGELVIAGKSFFFCYFKIAKHVSSYYMCIDWGDLIIHNLAFCIKLQLKVDFRLILIQLRFIPIQLRFIRFIFVSES